MASTSSERVTARDKFFAVIIFVLLIFSCISALNIHKRRAEVVIPAFLFGLTGTVAIQWWVGRKTEEIFSAHISVPVVRIATQLTGGAASLAAFSSLIYFALENSINQSAIRTRPEAHNTLSILDDRAEFVDFIVNPDATNALNIPVNPERQKKILDACTNGRGFCQFSPQELNAKRKNNLKEAFCLVCNEDLDRLSLYVFNNSLVEDEESSGSKAEEVLAIFDQKFCPKGSGNNIWLAPSVYKKLNLSKGAKVSIQVKPHRAPDDFGKDQIYEPEP